MSEKYDHPPTLKASADRQRNMSYDHKKIEEKWQKEWENSKLFSVDDNSKKPKYYQLETFPYPSAAGLHVGHPKGYIAEDIHARFMRMQGREVMYTMGWDAFGLPTENYALKVGKTPQEVAKANIENFKRQVQMFGLSYDWSREINTSSPEYYKWTQWLFIQLYKKGLAYQKKAKVNWCPKDQTVLANEQVVNGRCERDGELVEQKDMEQWFLKITDYAEKLLSGLEGLDWPKSTIKRQQDWIGKSEGAEIEFPIPTNYNYLILHGRNGSPDSHTFPWLKKSLEENGFQVQSPALPNTSEPNDEEQADYVEKNCEINENTVIIGHSFGGVVALRLLERGIKAKKVFLLCTPFSGNFLDKQNRLSVTSACKKGFDFKKIRQNAQDFGLIYDITDYVVPMSDGESFSERLGVSLIKIAGKEPHLSGLREPEVLTTILSSIRVFTTRPDTLFGATYMVLAPEHPLVEQITTEEQKNYVINYVIQTKKKTELQRTALEKDKTGVFTGAYAINPATKEQIPVWVADYVLMNYGTGAIMAVPAHDERDFEFAKKYDLPIKKVVEGNGELFIGDGSVINSGKYDGLTSEKAIKKMGEDFGKLKVQYKLRDWSISRQRYWGVPIPMVHCDKCGIVPVDEKNLPVLLPELKDFRPQGMPPLASSVDFIKTKCPNCGSDAKRDPETLDTFVDSSWYYLRYPDPQNSKKFADERKLNHWLPVDLYVIGAEHTVLHLLYSRFITKFLYDEGYLKIAEPFLRLFHVGLIQGPDGQKMSKSRGNVVNPDEIVEKYGADTVRVYEIFMGPFEDGQPWDPQGVTGSYRFLEKVWKVGLEPSRASGSERGDLNQDKIAQSQAPRNDNNIHKLIKKIGSDIPAFKFNTAIAAFMEFLNENKSLNQADWETFLTLLAPFAPHIAEELWHNLGHKDSIHLQAWPKYDDKLTVSENVTVVVQILGRVRAALEVATGLDQKEIKKLALADANIKKHLEGKQIIKEIFVKDRLINFVIK